MSLQVTTKIDGAPAVVCWSELDGYPSNSICLKSFVNGPTNAMSSKEQIMNKYGNKADMAKKLIYCLALAKRIPKGEAWQGDCLYTKDDLETEVVDGVECLTFQPNTILYAVPKDSDLGNDILNSEFGIVFHTRYKGTAGNFKQSFDLPLDTFKAPKGVYVLNNVMKEPKISGETNSKLNELYYDKFKPLADKLKNNKTYNDICSNELFMDFWNVYENNVLSDRQERNINVDVFVDDFIDFVAKRNNTLRDKAVSKLKTDVAKQKNIDKYNNEYNEIKTIVDKNVNVLVDMVKLLNIAIDIKQIIMDGHRSGSDVGLGTYVRSKTKGIIKTKPEGYSVSDGEDIVKLVDRADFSNKNRNDDIIKGFQR